MRFKIDQLLMNGSIIPVFRLGIELKAKSIKFMAIITRVCFILPTIMSWIIMPTSLASTMIVIMRITPFISAGLPDCIITRSSLPIITWIDKTLIWMFNTIPIWNRSIRQGLPSTETSIKSSMIWIILPIGFMATISTFFKVEWASPEMLGWGSKTMWINRSLNITVLADLRILLGTGKMQLKPPCFPFLLTWENRLLRWWESAWGSADSGL